MTRDAAAVAEPLNYLGKPAPLTTCAECGSDTGPQVILQKYTDGTARWHNFCCSCYQRTDLGSADVSTAVAAQAEVTRLRETLAGLEAAASNMLTGVSVHNNLHADAPARRKNIEGAVVSALATAAQAARAALARPLPQS